MHPDRSGIPRNGDDDNDDGDFDNPLISLLDSVKLNDVHDLDGLMLTSCYLCS